MTKTVCVPVEPTEAMLDAYWHGEGESREMRGRMHESGKRFWSAMLAASPSVVEGEPVVCAVCDGFVPTWGVKVCDCEYMAPCGTKPAPPSVSTGSRPQEAVPAEQAEPAVVAYPLSEAREAFLNMVADAKRWAFEYDGDETGCWATVTMVSDHSQVQELCDALGMTGAYDESTEDRIARYVEMPTPQPADGCSSNEGAALWAMHVRGPDDIYPAPDHATAQNWSDYVNDFVAQVGSDVEVVAAPVHWSGTAEAHAEGLPLAVAGWTLPDGHPALTILPQTEKGS